MNRTEFHLHPVYIEELQTTFGDVGRVVMEAVQWNVQAFKAVISLDVQSAVEKVFHDWDDPITSLRAYVACEMLRRTPPSHPLSRAICKSLADRDLTDGGRYQLAKCYSELGVAARQAGNYTIATSDLRNGIRILGDLPYRVVTANLFYSLGIALEHQAFFADAFKAFMKCVEIEQSLQRNKEAAEARERANGLKELIHLSSEEVAKFMMLDGTRLRRAGDMMGALAQFNIALHASRHANNCSLEATVYQNIAAIYFHQGETERSCAILEAGVERLRRKATPQELSELEISLASCYSAMKRWKDALKLLDCHYGQAVENRDEFLQGNCLHAKGEALFRQGKLDQAQATLEQAIELRRRTGERVREANTINELAVVAYHQGNLSRAESLNREALNVRIDADDYRGAAESLGNLSTILAKAGTTPQSLANVLRAARIVDQMRTKVGTGEESRAALQEKTGHYYRQALGLACDLNRPVSVFWTLQRLQNRTLVDSIAMACVPKQAMLTVEVFEEETKLFQRLRQNKENPNQVSETLSLMQAFYRDKVRPIDSSYARWRMGSPLRRRECENILSHSDGAAYVEVAEYSGTLYGICAGGPRQMPVAAFSSAIGPETNDESAEECDTVLFRKRSAEKILGKHIKHVCGGPGAITVVPHGHLARAPLHTLPIDGEPLVRRQPVRYLPQGALLQRERYRQQSLVFDKIAVIGDTRGDLAGARREAESIAAQLHCLPILGKEASREAIVNALTTADVVHFAGHAFFNSKNHRESGLVASDGVVTANDIVHYEVRPSLVVLNACESGVTGIGLGSELQGLVRSLLVGGAAYVICTLWKVDDRAAESFGTTLYNGLTSSDCGILHAVHAAQRQLLEQYSDDVVKWAPFIVVG